MSDQPNDTRRAEAERAWYAYIQRWALGETRAHIPQQQDYIIGYLAGDAAGYARGNAEREALLDQVEKADELADAAQAFRGMYVKFAVNAQMRWDGTETATMPTEWIQPSIQAVERLAKAMNAYNAACNAARQEGEQG